jgi:hypothetical protein
MNDKKIYATTELVHILTEAFCALSLLNGQGCGIPNYNTESLGKTAQEIENKVLNDLTTLLAKVKRVSPHEFQDKDFVSQVNAHAKKIEELGWALNDYFNPE